MKVWFSALELSKLGLPGLPRSKRNVNERAKRENWAQKLQSNGRPAARKSQARGGGMEYHISALPLPAQAALHKINGTPPAVAEARPAKSATATSLWAAYEAAPASRKLTARFRMDVINEVEKMKAGGLGHTIAVTLVVRKYQNDPQAFSRATLFNWIKQTRGKSKKDWLPALLPAHVGSAPRTKIDPEIILYARADYLRPEKPSFSSVYERMKNEIAPAKGWTLPHRRTLQRRFLTGVPYAAQVFLRDGVDALEAMFPAQKRDRREFHAMEAINADGHTWDVFVHDNQHAKPYRPVTCAIQDLYSGKILAWRTGKTLGSDLVRLAFADMFKNYGIPKICWLDNGREFASKLVTGGTPNRYRFKVKPEEPTGFLTALGVDIRWTRPYRGQSKPIERAFRDFCDHIAKHPKFAGAYTGNSVANQPSNYGSKSVPLGTFKKVIEAGIQAHNARTGRRTLTCQGVHSFDDVFKASYAKSIIQKASEEQVRTCLLATEYRRAHRKTGAIEILGNTYWSEEMSEYAGQRMLVRLDPDALHGSVYIYLQDGSYLCEAECWHAQGFGDYKAGREHARKKKAFMKAQKELAKLESSVSIQDVAAYLPDFEPEELPETKVVRPVFGVRGNLAVEVDEQPAIDFDVLEQNIQKISEWNNE